MSEKEEVKEILDIPNSEEYVDNHLKAINDMLTSRNYALMGGVSSISAELYRPRQITRDSIRRAVTKPYDNIDTLQQASMLLKATNGIYKRVLNYSSTMLTNDHMIYPLAIDKIKTADKLQKSYLEASAWLERFNVKHTACWIYERVLEQGELYLYKIEDGSGVVFQEIPNTLCMITCIENGIQKFGINLSKMNDKTVLAMPLEIQKLYKKFKAGSIKEKDLIDKSYYELKQNAVAFNLDRFASKGVPFYSTVFDDLMELEDMKDLKSENAIIESIKLIHQKLPIDKETGTVLMDFKLATAYHNATKSNLPRGTSITTNPLELQAVTLSDGSSTRINSNVAQSLRNIYDSAGINMELFNGEKNSNEAIASGIVADGFIPKRLQMMVEDYFNYEFSLKKHSGIQWKIKFIDTSHFDKEQRAKTTREDMAFGGSRLEYLATKGNTPYQGIAILKTEQLLGMDSIMIPQQSAHTMAGDTGSNDAKDGRPSKSETGGDGQSNQAELE